MNDFFQDLRQDEEYAILSVRMGLYQAIRQSYLDETDFKLHSIKQKNKEHYKNELLIELYKDLRKTKEKIRKIEQSLNH